MKTVNSISGGKTSAYLAKFFPADINVFSLVRVEDESCLWMNGKDEKTRQLISDRIGCEFIGTVEMDDIIYTILDLEQFTGQEIKIVTGKTFEQVIREAGNYLPNKMARFCTTKMKLEPIYEFLNKNIQLPCEMRIGYRPNELSRAEKIMSRADENGIEHIEAVVGKRGNQNKWGLVPYRRVKFPLIENNLTKDVIYNYWSDKPVRFAYRNNCVASVNRQPLMIAHMATKEKRKVEWFEKQEIKTGNTFLTDVTMTKILKFGVQNTFFDDDFSDCDSGYCGI